MISPTVGRKVWFYPVNEPSVIQIDKSVPCDATVVYPWGDHCVNLRITDHAGNTHVRTSVWLVQDDEERPASNHATWMPYQKGQAAKTEVVNIAFGKPNP